MTAFSFTTGNPSNLVANQNASMADIQGPLTDIRTKFNDGTLDETNVPNLSAAFTTYKTVWTGGFSIGTAGAATYIFGGYPGGTARGIQVVGAIGTGEFALYFDPSDWAANSRTTKLRLRVFWVTNAVAPATTFTFGLYPVATFGGASAAVPTIATLGTVITGSTVAVATPALSSSGAVTSSDFNAPAAGPYVPGVVIGATAGNSSEVFTVQLQYRQV